MDLDLHGDDPFEDGEPWARTEHYLREAEMLIALMVIRHGVGDLDGMAFHYEMSGFEAYKALAQLPKNQPQVIITMDAEKLVIDVL